MSKTDYQALVSRSTTGYRDVFAPGSPLLAEEGDAFVMLSFTGSTPHLQWRIWIPPGTRSLQSSLYTYASAPDSKVLMRMHQPPIGNLASVTPENAAAVESTNVLSLLLQGAEVPCYAPDSAGAVKLSTGRMDSDIVTTTGGWLYVNALQVPGAQIFKIESYISVDKTLYMNWYEHAIWDDQGNPVLGVMTSDGTSPVVTPVSPVVVAPPVVVPPPVVAPPVVTSDVIVAPNPADVGIITPPVILPPVVVAPVPDAVPPAVVPPVVVTPPVVAPIPPVVVAPPVVTPVPPVVVAPQKTFLTAFMSFIKSIGTFLSNLFKK